MARKSANQSPWLGPAVGVLLAVTAGFALLRYSVGSGLVRWSYDLFQVAHRDGFLVAPPPQPHEILIVLMDDRSQASLGLDPKVTTWDRAIHARLIDRLTAAEAKAIAFDVVFKGTTPGRPESDALLAEAAGRSGRVIMAADRTQVDEHSWTYNPPYDALLETAAAVGSVVMLPGPDLIVRQHTPEDVLPSLSQTTAEFVMGEGALLPRISGRTCWFNYYGPAGFLPAISYDQALDPTATPDHIFRDKVIFVGASIETRGLGERTDEFPNPFSFWTPDRPFITGVELHATAYLNWVHGEWLRRWSPRAELVVLLVLGAMVGFLLARLRPILATIAALGALVAVAVVFYLIFLQQRIWFPWLIVVTQLGIAYAWSILYNSVQLYVQKRMYEYSLSLYLSPKLVKKFSGNPNLLKPGAEEQIITIFFSDIADFTTISQHLTSAELAQMMNRYFQMVVTQCIHPTDGTVVKYIGDAVFAFWNAPEMQVDHAIRACEAAVRFREHEVTLPNGRPLYTRIGIHSGIARVGNFGSDDRVDYTALGEHVNLASRLEGLNKYLSTECLITQDTRELVGDRFLTRAVGAFQLKGFEHPIEVFELMGRKESAEANREWMETFAMALNNYHERNLEFAVVGFKDVLEKRPQDGPSRFYLERIEELQATALPQDWATFTMLKDK